ncbi:MAG: sugar ABC transporter permease [Oscillibacter sp.]|nr:sugar ABC transporter permease [Oscillibacter sp.]
MRTRRKKRLRNKEGIFLLLPALGLYSFVILIPVCNMIYTSFFDWNGIKQQAYRFVGLQNYIDFFRDYQTETAFKNVFLLAGIGVFCTIPIAFFLATVINKKFFGLRFFKTFYFIPVVINRVAISLMFIFILYPRMGPFVALMRALGFGNINVLGNASTAMLGVCLIYMWCDAGFQMIVFSSGLAAIPDELYEAAKIDGVTPAQNLWYITIPMMKSTFKIVLVFVFTGAFKMFDLVMALTAGGPGGATEVPNTLLYNNAFTYNRVGYADSIAVVVLLICLTFAATVNRLFQEKD